MSCLPGRTSRLAATSSAWIAANRRGTPGCTANGVVFNACSAAGSGSASPNVHSGKKELLMMCPPALVYAFRSECGGLATVRIVFMPSRKVCRSEGFQQMVFGVVHGLRFMQNPPGLAERGVLAKLDFWVTGLSLFADGAAKLRRLALNPRARC